MTGNRVVVYKGPGEVAVESTDYPKLELPQDVVSGLGLKRSAPHAAILKLVTTNICGSDQHMVRGRTTAPVGQTLGHEITGEVVEVGDDVLFVKEGDICSVPVQHRLRPLPDVQRGQDRHLPERQPGPGRRRLRVRRHGRLDRRPGGVRHGPVRRLQPAAASPTATRRWRRSST